jgi:hypothetical protein
MNRTRGKNAVFLLLGAGLGASLLTASTPAAACGCFTPPDPSVPIVQAGERIAFAMANGQVTAHIQIQYAGNAGEFGWILPLPSVPKLELGSDELFTQLTAQTQPKYKLNRVYEGQCGFGQGRGGGFANSAPTAAGAEDTSGKDGDPSSPLVYQDSVGPYDYAVLKADSKDEMLKWLADNRYFVPAGTDATVAPYIHPGAYFLALKLRSGSSTGDLQPVVLHYQSDLPMIPLVLTSVAAQKDMGIQVWMLGAGRAIPRNYFHTVINDAKLDWLNGSANYNDVIIAATKEAEGRHTFVTEYAGSSSVMQNVLNPVGRFGTQPELAAQPDDIMFLNYLNTHQFAYTSQLTSILGRYLPEPAGLAAKNITATQFYQNASYYLSDSYRKQFPNDLAGYAPDFRPAAIAQEIFDRVVNPALMAGALFDAFPYLTRLYTTLSPDDMNKDPVFSFNPKLPDWPNVHEGTLTYHCGFFGSDNAGATRATLKTASGWVIEYPSGTGQNNPSFVQPAGPFSERIEILAEEGPPTVVTDNADAIGGRLNAGGCDVAFAHGRTGLGAAALLFVGLALTMRSLRRRRAL